MELKRFIGPDMRTALRLVREQLGPDAIILSNRRTAEGVEIVAGPEGSTDAPIAPSAPAAPVGSAAARAQPARATAAVAPVAVETRASVPEMAEVRSELRDLRELLQQGLGDMRNERAAWGPGVEGRAWRRLTRLGLPNELVRQLVATVDASGDWDSVWNSLRSHLSRRLREAGDSVAAGGIFALVGPTGAGKTTTLCKLAVRHVLEHGPKGLALLSLDGTRLGGADMLRAVARLLDVPFHCAQDGESLEELLGRVSGCPLVLVDTAGLSRRAPQHQEHIEALGRLRAGISTLLVLPANAQRAWLESALQDYLPAAPAAAVVTKLDETVSLGEALGALLQARLPVAYVTDGQEIPDDIRIAAADELVSRAVALDPEPDTRDVDPVRAWRGGAYAAVTDIAARIA